MLNPVDKMVLQNTETQGRLYSVVEALLSLTSSKAEVPALLGFLKSLQSMFPFWFIFLHVTFLSQALYSSILSVQREAVNAGWLNVMCSPPFPAIAQH